MAASFSDCDIISVVMTEPREKDGVTKYHVKGRVCLLFRLPDTNAWSDLCYKPILLDLLKLVNFTDAPSRRSTCFLRGFGGTPDSTDPRVVYPCTISHIGRLGRLYTVYAESSQARSEWKDKLQEAIGLHKAVQESKKVFVVQTLSSDTFVVPSMLARLTNHSWNAKSAFTGRVTCSVPFSEQQIVLVVCW
jgi:hypothetical protein